MAYAENGTRILLQFGRRAQCCEWEHGKLNERKGRGSGTCDDESEEDMGLGSSDGNGKARKHGAEMASFVLMYTLQHGPTKKGTKLGQLHFVKSAENM
ncbi:unnamed protein product [Sphenostylis stenocarpa]|uniref:Uncharacterized protein n=1 Tax=Sphenostylis stenocarpa TaxID=92480 RepID=A0AA86SCM5_9FABA|nr:unnamed protein product [Sphenostylis stenocarpa]